MAEVDATGKADGKACVNIQPNRGGNLDMAKVAKVTGPHLRMAAQ
jgi:hypothetical protein